MVISSGNLRIKADGFRRIAQFTFPEQCEVHMLKLHPYFAEQVHALVVAHFDGTDRTSWPISLAGSVAEISRAMGGSMASPDDIRNAVLEHLLQRGLNIDFDDGKSTVAHDRCWLAPH